MKYHLYLWFCLSILSFSIQGQTISIDLSQVKYNNNNTYLYGTSNLLTPLNFEGPISIVYDDLPMILEISERKRSKLLKKGAIWLDGHDVQLVGDLTSNEIVSTKNRSENQILLEQIIKAEKKPDLDKTELIRSLPMLVVAYDQREFLDITYLQQIIEQNRDLYKNHPAFKLLEKYLQSLNRLIRIEGDKLLFLTGIDKNSDTVKVSPGNKAYTFIDFSGSWCRPCIQAIPEIVKLHEEYHNKVDFVTLWYDESQEMFLSMSKKAKEAISWTSLRDPDGIISKKMEIRAFPTYVLYDTRGKEIKKWTGGHPKNFENFIN